MAKLAQEMGPTREDFALLKKEVDALQIEVMKPAAPLPWHRESSKLVAVCALALSVASSFYSWWNGRVQDINAAQAELPLVLEKLAQVRIERAKMYLTSQSPGGAINADFAAQSARTNMESEYNAETAFLTGQALSLYRDRLGASNVTAAELENISYALQTNYNLPQAMELAQAAEAKADTLNDKIVALRLEANLDYVMGKADDGRKKFESAMKILDSKEYGTADALTRANYNTYTQIFWSGSEAGRGDFQSARSHLLSAKAEADALPPSPARADLVAHLAIAWQQVATASAAPASP